MRFGLGFETHNPPFDRIYHPKKHHKLQQKKNKNNEVILATKIQSSQYFILKNDYLNK